MPDRESLFQACISNGFAYFTAPFDRPLQCDTIKNMYCTMEKDMNMDMSGNMSVE